MIKFTETNAVVTEVSFLPSSERPAIITRLKTEDKDVGDISHMVRLHNPKSARIGLDELRAAFPTQLASAPTQNETIKRLLTRSKDFMGLKVRVAIEPQLEGGRPKKGDNGEILYNIRLRSNTHDLDDKTADDLIASLNLGTQADLEKLAKEANAAV